jgi:hypothetical protein
MNPKRIIRVMFTTDRQGATVGDHVAAVLLICAFYIAIGLGTSWLIDHVQIIIK